MPVKFLDFVVMVLIMFAGPILWAGAYKERVTYEAVREITEGFAELMADHGEFSESLYVSTQNKLAAIGEDYSLEITNEYVGEQGAVLKKRLYEPERLKYKSIIEVSVVKDEAGQMPSVVYRSAQRVLGVSRE